MEPEVICDEPAMTKYRTVSLRDDQFQLLDRLARKTDKSKGELIADALGELIADKSSEYRTAGDFYKEWGKKNAEFIKNHPFKMKLDVSKLDDLIAEAYLEDVD